MKILVCTDGSVNSEKAIAVASEMVGDCSINEVAIIHVHESSALFPDYWQGQYPFSLEEEAQLKDLDSRLFEERKQYFAKAVKAFEKHNIPVQTIFKMGHPPEVISQIAADDNYDLIVIGRRGNSGIKNLFLGSVSNAVLQAAKTNVLIVK